MEKVLNDFIKKLQSFYKKKDLHKMIESGLKDTLNTTIKTLDDGTTFVVTGDIPAMWLRDSSAQVRPFLYLANKSDKIKQMIRGVIEKHKDQILYDPYANAFNIEENGEGHQTDETDMKPGVFERKYEIDSLCYPIQLAYLYYLNTGDNTIFDEKFLKVVKTIIDTFIIEQSHEEKSTYRFVRTNPEIMWCEERVKYETLARDGLGTPVAKTGLIWCGFRPSDDACQYHYLIPSNMFAVVVMDYLLDILPKYYKKETEFLKKVKDLREEVNAAIYKHAVVEHKGKKVFAYEVDGLGNYLLMDDANVPSLLSIPYLGFTSRDDEIYQNTRALILSKDNPFYYSGKFKGIGSPHTPENHIWHISLGIQGMTSDNEKEKEEILKTFRKTHAGTYMMHEGFDVNDPKKFSRPWFSWSNSIFVEFIMSLNNIYIKGFCK